MTLQSLYTYAVLTHRRVRQHPSRSPSPTLDVLGYLFGVLAPLFTLPQILSIWHNASAEGISLITWIAYWVCSVFWFAYSWYHHDRPLILTHGLWVVMQTAVLVGILVFR